MDTKELYQIIRKALEDGVSIDWISLVIIGVIVLVGAFLGSYFRTKGKNLATKEDIQSITNKIEAVKTDYAKQLEDIKHHNRIIENSLKQRYDLSVAAIETRLAKHQEAYSLWWELMRDASDQNSVGKCILKCQDWHIKNSLYLSAEARKAFRKAYIAAQFHSELRHTRENSKEILERFEEIQKAGDVLVEAVSLPSWGKDEFKPIKSQGEKG